MLADAAWGVFQVAKRQVLEAVRMFSFAKVQHYDIVMQQTAAHEVMRQSCRICIGPKETLDAAERRTKRTLRTYVLNLQRNAGVHDAASAASTAAAAAPAPAQAAARDSEGPRMKRKRTGLVLPIEAPSAAGMTHKASVMGGTGAAGEVRARPAVVN